MAIEAATDAQEAWNVIRRNAKQVNLPVSVKVNMLKTLSLFVLLLFCVGGSAATVDLYLVTGQSNSTNYLRGGIESAVGGEVLWGRHNGHPIESWYGTSENTPNNYYLQDFFGAAGGGILENRIAEIVSAGDVPVFRGLFWFQGEADTSDATRAANYTARFNSMVNNLIVDVGHDNFEVIVAVIDANSMLSGAPDPVLLDSIRDQQAALGTAQIDSRGYDRADVWHLTNAAAFEFGEDMGDLYLATAAPVPILSAWALLVVPAGALAFTRRR